MTNPISGHVSIAPDPLKGKVKTARGWMILEYRIECEGICLKCMRRH